jgi:hypothetical protein
MPVAPISRVAPQAAPAVAPNPPLMPRDVGRASYRAANGPLFTVSAQTNGGPQASDPIQHGLGDCYFVSELSEIALRRPDLIRKMIHDNNNGTVTVRLFNSGHWQDITVDRTLPFNIGSSSPAYALPAQNGATWPCFVEKAFAVMKGGYAAIGGGGVPGATVTALLGWTDNRHLEFDATPAGQSQALAAAKAAIAAGAMITVRTRGTAPRPDGKVGHHIVSVLASRLGPGGEPQLAIRNQIGPKVEWLSMPDFAKRFGRLAMSYPPAA